jgi:hypothetical integral membrane protein (TIGR02206 family)
MKLFGPLHLAILGTIAVVAAVLVWLCRRGILQSRPVQLALGLALASNELVWWAYRYSREGLHMWNLPLQLCDAAVWLSAMACLTAFPAVVEFAWFAGLAGAGMALLTPDLISPWPSYPAIYFFTAHGGIVISMAALVLGGRWKFRRNAVWRSFVLLLIYAAFVGLIDFASGSNYMFLVHKPASASPLDRMGPWPWYLVSAAAVGLMLFWLLWLPVWQREADAPTPALAGRGPLKDARPR